MKSKMYNFGVAIIIIVTNLFISSSIFAQSPNKMSYQAVVRQSGDALVSNTTIGMQISILQGSANGAVVYAETQTPSTNDNGLVTIEIGDGTVVTGAFETIDWSAGTYFIKTEIDLAGATNYTITGTSQMLSVPYALYAKTAEKVADSYLDQLVNIFENNGMVVVDFRANSIFASTELPITFTDLSTINSTSWQWDFGDGNTSSDQNPTHIYETEGVYTVSLTSSNDILNFTKTRNDYITVYNYDGSNSGSFIDPNDGNVYKVVVIEDQVWMAENLKATKYSDGTDIPMVSNNTEWGELTTPSYCWYNNDEATYENRYGALYNWHAVNTGKLCPSGWHVPTEAEWSTLINYLDGAISAGGKLKEVGTTHWDSPNTGATDEVEFSGLPGGFRYLYGAFNSVGENGYWWSSTQSGSNNAKSRALSHNSSSINSSDDNMKAGFSVRCLRNY